MMYIFFFWFIKLLLKSDKLLSLIERLNINVGSWKILAIFHADSSVLHSSQSHEVEFVISSAD